MLSAVEISCNVARSTSFKLHFIAPASSRCTKTFLRRFVVEPRVGIRNSLVDIEGSSPGVRGYQREVLRLDARGEIALEHRVPLLSKVSWPVKQLYCHLNVEAGNLVGCLGEKGKQPGSFAPTGDYHVRVLAMAEEEASALPSSIAETDALLKLYARLHHVPAFERCHLE